MLVRARSTPWRHDSELALVRDWFFPQHASFILDSYGFDEGHEPQDFRQRAVQKVNLWIFKAGRIPHAIAATSYLNEAKLFDQAEGREKLLKSLPGNGVNILQNVYAMAFIKFVNGFVDRDVARNAKQQLSEAINDRGKPGENPQPKVTVDGSDIKLSTYGESSMYAHAASIGMPEAFVNLRHQVTHGEVPEVKYLRAMNERGLEWLWKIWWSREDNINTTKARALRELDWRRELGQQEHIKSRGAGSSIDTTDDRDQQTTRNAAEQSKAMDSLDSHGDLNKRKRDVVEYDSDVEPERKRMPGIKK